MALKRSKETVKDEAEGIAVNQALDTALKDKEIRLIKLPSRVVSTEVFFNPVDTAI